jgi:hypothetical protein
LQNWTTPRTGRFGVIDITLGAFTAHSTSTPGSNHMPASAFKTSSLVVGAGLGAVVAALVFVALVPRWWVLILVPALGAAIAHVVSRSRLHSASAPRALATRRLLAAGFLAGPFIGTLAVVSCLALAKWPQLNQAASVSLLALPVAGGALCLWLRFRPMGWKVVYLLPYAFVYYVATYVFSVIPAIMLGAPK